MNQQYRAAAEYKISEIIVPTIRIGMGWRPRVPKMLKERTEKYGWKTIQYSKDRKHVIIKFNEKPYETGISGIWEG